MIYKITLSGQEIEYELERKSVKNINLRIRSNGTVYVSADSMVSQKVIEDFLLKKAGFITSALSMYKNISKYEGTPRQFVTGESFRYLGKDLRLVVRQGKNNVESDGVYLNLTVDDTTDFESKKRLIERWYSKKRKEIFNDVVTDIYPIFKKYGIEFPKIIIRYMTSRWGSCQPKRGTITLNQQLIEVPRETIEYVIMHEFVHFLHHNHSKAFYETLFTLMPDWEQRKIVLENSAFNGAV
jgi:predicted metal-dependent hydrolase